MKKLTTAVAALLVVLLAPAAAPAKVLEVGRASENEELPQPSCPNSPCFAISRTTGYQAKVGTNRGLMKIPENGRIVAWTIRLSKPGPKQVDRKSTRLNSSHANISYAVFCLKKKTNNIDIFPVSPPKQTQYPTPHS